MKLGRLILMVLVPELIGIMVRGFSCSLGPVEMRQEFPKAFSLS